MSYPIWIGVEKDGTPVIGVKNGAREGVYSERVYGSQLRHRVVVETPIGYAIMTPTQAREAGLEIVDTFA